jgi:hypothetical protein
MILAGGFGAAEVHPALIASAADPSGLSCIGRESG